MRLGFLWRCLLICVMVFTNPAAATSAPNQDLVAQLLAPKQTSFLDVKDAFVFEFDQQGSTFHYSFDIADGYYLYKKKLEVVGKNVTAQLAPLPQGKVIEDEFFGRTEVYFKELTGTIRLSDYQDGAHIKIRYQGCAEAGLCYPAEVMTFDISAFKPSKTKEIEATTPERDAKPSESSDSDGFSLTERLAQGTFATNLMVFFLLGVTLAFTPCVFPMFPILSSLIAGQQGLSTKRAFSLSFVYVQGMALTYALLGLIVASVGGHIQGYLQHPYVLISFSILFVALALSMFGAYEIRLPSSVMNKLTNISNQQKGGNYTGVFFMGVLSSLIASPCTTAPLSAALLYVAQSGDYIVGGVTLYALSLGMGLPLLLLGTSGGKLLPKAGGWMEQVKILFGFIMLFVPLILLERILPWDTILLLGAALGVATAVYLSHWRSLVTPGVGKSLLWLSAALLFVASVLLGKHVWLDKPATEKRIQTLEANIAKQSAQLAQQQAQLAEGGTDNTETATPASLAKWHKVADLTELNAFLKDTDKPVMVDLYAEWCVACKEFEQFTFPDPEVQKAFSRFKLVKMDLTESDEATIELMQHFTVFGLPTILFFDADGNELTPLRVTGFLNAEPFADHLNKVLAESY